MYASKKHLIALFDEVSNTETRSQEQRCILLSLPNYGIINGRCSQNKTVTTLLHVRVLMLSSKWWLFVLHEQVHLNKLECREKVHLFQ